MDPTQQLALVIGSDICSKKAEKEKTMDPDGKDVGSADCVAYNWMRKLKANYAL